jgi:hypothetical protein
LLTASLLAGRSPLRVCKEGLQHLLRLGGGGLANGVGGWGGRKPYTVFMNVLWG